MRTLRQVPEQSYLRSIFIYDPETGSFTRACDRHKWKAGQPMGTIAGGYLSINIDRTIFRAHRLAWTYMTGEQPPRYLDHKDGDPLNNRWDNIRAATQTQNMLNKAIQSNNKTGYKGVYFSAQAQRFIAKTRVSGKNIHLGSFGTPEEAKAAYDAACKILHGDFFRAS